MALDAKKVYGALTTYVNESLAGVGALKGANCTIKSIVHQDGVNTVTFEWTADDGTKRENVMQVYDGTPIYVWESGNTYHYGDLVIYESCFYRCVYDNSDVEFDPYHWQEISAKDSDYDIVPSTNELPARFTSADKKMYFVYTEAQFYYWDGTAWIPQTEAKQFVTMPTASATWENRTVQFIGTTDANYTHGFFYECVEDSGSYSWVNVATTDLSGKVDKETGKGLSTNDFTNTYKNQLDSLGTSSTKDYTNTFDEDGTEVTTGKAIADAINTEGIIDTPSQIMSFADGSDSPMKSCTVSIEPVQDLHGYDRPWVGGAGKNLLPMTVDGIKAANTGGTWSGNAYTLNGVTFTILTDNDRNVLGIKANGTASVDTTFRVYDEILNLGIQGYKTISGCPSNGSTSTYYLTLFRTNSGSIQDLGNGTTYLYDTEVRHYVFITIKSGTILNSLIFQPMIESGNTKTTFEPYSNICPITGHNEVTAYVRGFNLWDEEWEGGSLNDVTGEKISNPRIIRSKNFIPIIPNTTYYLRTAGLGAIECFYDKDKNFIVSGGYYDMVFTTPTDAHYMLFRMASDYGTTYKNDICINLSKITGTPKNGDYVPYSTNTYTTDLGTTVYGGTLDLVSGVLTVDRAEIASYAGETLPGAWISSLDEYQQGTTPTTGAQVVYELATPYTVQLTPTQVRSLLGYNNVWSDSGEMNKIIYTKGTTTLSLTIADLYNIIANLDARVKELEGKDEVDLSTMSDEDLDEMPEEEEAEEETAEESE